MSVKIIISGGGTGGHIFPALSIGGEIKSQFPDAEVLFVGAVGGMEMTLVPQNGYAVEGVWISGIQRQLSVQNLFKNLLFPIKFFVSIVQAYRIIHRFQPDAVVGVGGYASGPLGRVAGWKGIPLFVCEQNAFPGLTNRWLAGKAKRILLGNADAMKYFDATKCVVTGNPVRKLTLSTKAEAATKLGLNPDKPVILSLGGSLGALKMNEAIMANKDAIIEADVQWVWQCGKRYYASLNATLPPHQNLKLLPFIEDMAVAYSAADLIVSRAGGSTISELIQLSKPAILVPSPNVAEDHQTKNAMSLVNVGAAEMVKDVEAQALLVKTAIEIVTNPARLAGLQSKIATVEKHDAAKEIVAEILKFIKR